MRVDPDDEIRRQPALGEHVPQHRDQRGVGVQGRGAAAQHDGAAGLEREAGSVDRHVRARLVDHPDHAHRHPHLAQLEAVGEHGASHHLADGVGQRGGVAQLLRDRRDPLRVQGEPVAQTGGHAGLVGGGEVLGVGGDDLVGAGDERLGHGVQQRVLLGAAEAGEHGLGVLRGAGGAADGRLDGKQLIVHGPSLRAGRPGSPGRPPRAGARLEDRRPVRQSTTS